MDLLFVGLTILFLLPPGGCFFRCRSCNEEGCTWPYLERFSLWVCWRISSWHS